jgi:hypothetical protein
MINTAAFTISKTIELEIIHMKLHKKTTTNTNKRKNNT